MRIFSSPNFSQIDGTCTDTATSADPNEERIRRDAARSGRHCRYVGPCDWFRRRRRNESRRRLGLALSLLLVQLYRHTALYGHCRLGLRFAARSPRSVGCLPDKEGPPAAVADGLCGDALFSDAIRHARTVTECCRKCGKSTCCPIRSTGICRRSFCSSGSLRCSISVPPAAPCARGAAGCWFRLSESPSNPPCRPIIRMCSASGARSACCPIFCSASASGVSGGSWLRR